MHRLFTVSDRKFLAACLAVHIVLRVAVLLALPIVQTSDFDWYYQSALGIAAGQGYAQDGVPTAFWPVGWPAFLGLLFRIFGSHQLVGQLANLALSALSIVLVVSIGTRSFGDKRVGRLAAVVVALLPNQIAYVPLLSTEIFYEFLLLAAVYCLLRNRPAFTVAAGLVFGIATLTKAQSLLIPLILLIAIAFYQGRRRDIAGALRKICIVYAMMFLVISPWTIRNYYVLGAFVPVSTNGGVTLLTGNNPTAAGDFTPSDPLYAELSQRPEDQIAVDAIAKKRALDWISHNPGRFIALIPLKIWRLWAPDGDGEWFYQAGYSHYGEHVLAFRAVRVLNQFLYVILAVLSLPALVVLVPRRDPLPNMPQAGWVFVFYFTLISVVFSGQSRFHYSLIPWIAMYSASTVLHRLPAWRSRRDPAAQAV